MTSTVRSRSARLVSSVGCAEQKASPTANLRHHARRRADSIRRRPGSARRRRRSTSSRRRSTSRRATSTATSSPDDVDVDVFISFGGVKTGANSACGADDSGRRSRSRRVTLNGGPAHEPHGDAAGGVRLDVDLDRRAGVGRHRRVADDLLPQRLHRRGADAARSDGGQRDLLLAVQRQVPHLRPRHRLGAARRRRRSTATPSPSPTPAWRRGSSTACTCTRSASRRRRSSRGASSPRFSGNYSKFVGFTELNFPLFTTADSSVPLATVPPPVPLRLRRHRQHDEDARRLRQRAVTCTICDRSADPTGDGQRRTAGRSTTSSSLDNDGTCDGFTNIAVELPAKVLGTFDPLQVVGKTATHRRHAAQQLGAESVSRRQRQHDLVLDDRRRAPRAPASAGTATRARTTSGRSIRDARTTSPFSL